MAVLRGERLDEEAIARAAITKAQPFDPSLSVEWQVQDSLGALHAGNAEDAVRIARRASRAAATDGILQGEYLANLALARVRRYRGLPHYAIRILSALQAVVPPIWDQWCRLELLLSGSPNSYLAGGHLSLEASHLEVALSDSTGFLPLFRDVANYRALLDVDAPVPESAAAFIWGEHHATPGGIRDAQGDTLVLALPQRRARRVFRRGIDAMRIQPALFTATGRRLQVALCVGLLAGVEGLDKDQFFRMLYGFDRVDLSHDDILRGLVHRMRHADDTLNVQFGDRIVVLADGPYAVPDPRCEQSLEDLILAYIAKRSGGSIAKEVAKAVQVPLRTVQRALADLVEEGLCIATPDGRRLEYVVDDTTFSEPTLHRLRGRWR